MAQCPLNRLNRLLKRIYYASFIYCIHQGCGLVQGAPAVHIGTSLQGCPHLFQLSFTAQLIQLWRHIYISVVLSCEGGLEQLWWRTAL